MEVWALYAYGAAHVLQEVLTIKSDDVVGRVRVYESLVKGKPVNEAGVPESFRVLIKEFQALGLDISILNTDGTVKEIKDYETEEDEESIPVTIDELDMVKDEESENIKESPIEENIEEDDEFEVIDDEFEKIDDDLNLDFEEEGSEE